MEGEEWEDRGGEQGSSPPQSTHLLCSTAKRERDRALGLHLKAQTQHSSEGNHGPGTRPEISVLGQVRTMDQGLLQVHGGSVPSIIVQAYVNIRIHIDVHKVPA